jgi:UPF0755 protein
MNRKNAGWLLGLVVATTGIVWFVVDRSYHTTTYRGNTEVSIVIPEGLDVWEIADILQENHLISSEYAFVFGVWRDGLRGKLLAGAFSIPPNLSPSDIAHFLTVSRKTTKDIRITFPEGWTAADMAQRLSENGFSGEAFLAIAENPDRETLSKTFPFLAELPEGATLEGFLFPDTYLFSPDASAETLVNKMLATFETKVIQQYGEYFASDNEASSSVSKLFSVITMASIVENEVPQSLDRKIVSGVFAKRLSVGMALQSDATLAYVLDERKVQHNASDLAFDSPYNTYKYPGLPPGPVCNPSLDAIDAALFPEDSPYWYFLSDPKTGKTYFAEDFEKHKQNKGMVGL